MRSAVVVVLAVACIALLSLSLQMFLHTTFLAFLGLSDIFLFLS